MNPIINYDEIYGIYDNLWCLAENKIPLIWHSLNSCFLELEVVLRVVVADVFHHLANTLFFVASERNHALLDVVAEEVTHGATEILMTWV